ncbi:MAG TPA: Fic family protein [Actinomycetota bacterium]|nr:Fic family protein [Actinomycetota bacterium]
MDLQLDDKLQLLLSKADLAIGRLDGVIEVIPNPDRFVYMYVRREAVLSSQIEGTQASLMDVLEYEAQEEQGEAGVDVREIINYIAAMRHGLDRLSELPVSRRLICEVHAELMKDVRGGEPQKMPGQFRKSQNWIGGASPATARFVPPPADVVGPSFADLENFLHDDSLMPALIKAGIAHAQFETIHPFLDGNGRTGRLLITFWLVERKVLRKPLLYPSLFFKEHKEEYGNRLQAIRDKGEWEEWIEFFLDGVAQVADEAYQTALTIFALRQRDREKINERLRRRAATALILLDELLKLPVVRTKTVERMISVSQPTATSLLESFVDLGILRETTGRRRYRVYSYDEYLTLFPGGDSKN